MDELPSVKFKPIAVPHPNIGIDTSNNIANLVANDERLNSSLNTDILNNFRNTSESREVLYKIFDEMNSDPIISGALELYSDDSTEYNDQGEIVWVTSDDQNVSQVCNNILKDLKIDENAWSYIYCLIKYGDVYLETFRTTDYIETQNGKDNLIKNTNIIQEGLSNSKDTQMVESVIVNVYGKNENLQNYIEMVSNPAEIFELTKRGKCAGYIKVPKNGQNTNGNLEKPNYQFNYITDDIYMYDPTKYIHICLPNPSNRNPEEVELFKYTNTSNKDEIDRSKQRESLTYKVKRGKSILYDIYRTHKELSLLTDSLLLNRVVRSAIVRIMQVEVGEMGKTETMQLLQRIKSLFESKTSLTASQQMTEYNSPGALEHNVYVPTRNGAGAISVNNLGGDVNVKEIADVDYFLNKLFAGLKIPKPFLGYMDDNAGFSGGESLTKSSGRYAKTIKRIQNVFAQGIKTLLNIFLIDKGLISYVNKFQVKMVTPATLDEQDRMESLTSKAQVIDTIMNLLSDVQEPTDKLKILQALFKNYIDIPEVNELLDGIVKSMPQDQSLPGEQPIEGEQDNFNDIDFGGDNVDNSMAPQQDTGDMEFSEESSEPQASSNTEDTELPSPQEFDVDLSDNEEIE